MILSKLRSLSIACLTGWLAVTACYADDLIQPPDEIVRYQLTNLRVQKTVVGEQIVFDYRQTKSGKGQARLVARTDNGQSQILGLPIRIEKTGTIRLEDMHARVRSILNGGRDDFGMEFYFVVSDRVSNIGVTRKYLVSNSIRHGKMSTRVEARSLNKEEREEDERARKAMLPPEDLPVGYVRGTNDTPLVPGAPVLYGVIGQWKPAEVVELKSSTSVRLKPDRGNVVRTIRRKDWIAVSEKTLQELRTNPGKFSTDVVTLPKGNLILGDDMQPLISAMDLLKGTPLVREKYSKWKDVYFISSDNVSVRVLIRDSKGSSVEFIPFAKLAIRKQTLADQSSDAAKSAYAANIADFENRAKSLPGEGGAMGSSQGFSSGTQGFSSGLQSGASAAPAPAEPKVATLRIWSDRSAKFKVEARFVKQEGGKVFLNRPDGRTIGVPFDMLSGSDQTYLKEQQNPSGNPFSLQPEVASSESDEKYSRLLQPMTQVGDLRWGAKSVAISPNNRLLMIGRKGSAGSLVELPSGRVLVDSGRMDHMGDIGVCGFTPDGGLMLMGGQKGVFEVYEVSDKGKLKIKGQHPLHAKEITTLSIGRGGRHALSGDEDKTVKYWDIETGKPIATLDGFDGKIKATCVSASGGHLMATDGQMLKVYSVSKSSVTREFEVGRSPHSGQAAAFSPNGRILAVGDGYNIHLWDLSGPRKLGTLEGEKINWSMVFAPDGQHLLTGTNGAILVWDCLRMMKLQTNRIGESFYVQAISISPDGSLVSAPDAHSSVAVLETGQ